MGAALTADRLRQVVSYDMNTGAFAFVASGRQCGRATAAGYLRITIDGARYLAHRLAWLYVTGMWPRGVIDHINMDRADNRVANLRDVSIQVNVQNVSAPRTNNASGYLGVSFCKQTGSWVAQIRHSGKKRHIGRFKSALEANDAYLAVKRVSHIGCTI